jgi:L-lysine 6-oxidase
VTVHYAVHPSIGIARVGNSTSDFYLAPEKIGGLPIACDKKGNPIRRHGALQPVEQFKDAEGRIKRQAARFKIFKYDDENPQGREITLRDKEIKRIEWTVHLANKKAAWYEFMELCGDTMLGQDNSYAARKVALRNAAVLGDDNRRKLIIDAGPRTVTPRKRKAELSRDSIPPDYSKFGSFPNPSLKPYPINTLGEMMMDDEGRLLVVGAYGNTGGETPITDYSGADTWHDDIADGPVTATLILENGQKIQLDAWVIVGSPKFAPELVNIGTLDDVIYDVGVRYKALVSELYDGKRWPKNNGWNPDYIVSYERDIQPILKRFGDYRWVANLDAMTTFFHPPFDPTDNSEGNKANRRSYFGYLRKPDGFFRAKLPPELARGHERLLSDNGVPLMPLNSGSNSIDNVNVDKFMSLTPTQYCLFHQWAEGKFTTGQTQSGEPKGVHPLDRASVGNCVGHPMCPGIEVTWNTRNPAIYRDEAPYRIKHRHDENYYKQHGLSLSADETDGQGCEPGDLTKRMAIPWQADFFDCADQDVNFTDPKINQKNDMPLPPTYYVYWWPPQSPLNVYSGAMTAEEQRLDGGFAAGRKVLYTRGINTFAQMITAWKYMGFILNQNTGADREAYPYFVEKERNYDKFVASTIGLGRETLAIALGPGSSINDMNLNAMPVFYLKEEGKSDG